MRSALYAAGYVLGAAAIVCVVGVLLWEEVRDGR